MSAPRVETASVNPLSMPPVLSEGRQPGISNRAILVILAMLAILPYLNTLSNGFVYDDNTQVLNNPYIQNFRHLKEIFSTTVWSYIGVQGVSNYYRPMMTFGYLLCYQVFGPLAYGFHLASVLLHATVACALFLITKEIFRHRLLAFVAAGLFALHPVHSESVAWIAAVTDLELTIFYLLAFWSFLRVARPGGGRSDRAQLAMAGSFILALVSKEQALTLPVLATTYEHFYREDRGETSRAQKFWRYGLLWLLAAAYLLFRVRFFGALAPVLQISDLTWYQTFLSGVGLIGQYCAKLLWPVHLCAFYVFQRSTTLLDTRVIVGLTAIALGTALFAVLWRRARLVSFALLWFLVTLGPVLNPCWMAANVFTERYLYLPSVGFCWVAAWGWVRLWERSAPQSTKYRRALVIALGLVAALWAIRVVTRNPDWRDDVRLYTVTLASSPGSYHIRNNLGTVYWKQGKIDAAETEWRKALALSPRNVIFINNLGMVLAHRKQFADATLHFERAMQYKPNYTDAHLNLGNVYVEMGRHSDAEWQYRAAVALSPLNVEARNKLGELYWESGRLVEAEEQFRHSVQSEPNWTAYAGLGDIYARWNDTLRAEQSYRRAIELQPVESRVHFSLAKLYETAGRRAEAIRQYQAGLETDPGNSEARTALARLRAVVQASPNH
ncbi:MAG: tetratricopeptide repeat protein [Terriglobia bacterium]